MDKVDIQSRRIVFDDKYKIEEAMFRFPRFDGQMSKPERRLVFERGNSSAAIIWNRDTQKVLLTNQFRYPTYDQGPGWISEVVAGVIDENETSGETIRREIEEEIGYKVTGELTHIATFYVSPGVSSEKITLYYVEVSSTDRVSKGGGLASENEDIKIEEWSPSDLWHALESGEINDAKTIIAIQWLQRKMA
ncbi:MAG: NUDIX domain-containing protein [Ktedonobacteraceae bacterium]|nr:NUDIX domain-containing protein [Ktedonobacteraceae bacterium]